MLLAGVAEGECTTPDDPFLRSTQGMGWRCVLASNAKEFAGADAPDPLRELETGFAITLPGAVLLREVGKNLPSAA